MKFNKAIQTVAKFAARGRKAPELYQSVMFVPGAGDARSKVFATDGMLSCMVAVDNLALPVALVPVDAILPIARHKLTSVERNEGELTFKAETGGTFKALLRDPTGYPKIPVDDPPMVELEHWNHIWQVIHAAAEDKSKTPTFKNIRFRPKLVEATDAIRVAVANVPGWHEDRLVPAKLLRGWKDGRVYAALTDTLVWFKHGDEVRFAPVRVEGTFPDCAKLLPEAHDWPAMVLETKRLTATCVKAVSVSALKTVALDFNGKELVVKAWSEEEGGKGYRMALLGSATDDKAKATKIVNGKYLIQALRAIRTPNVRLCYQDQADGPLRLESGAMAQGLWPWRA